jgi:hypothetical protein
MSSTMPELELSAAYQKARTSHTLHSSLLFALQQ